MNSSPRQSPSSFNFDAPSLPFALIGFFIPIVGLILYFINRGATPRKAGSALNGAGLGFGMSVVFMLFTALVASRAQPPAMAVAPQGSRVAAAPAESDGIVVAKKVMTALVEGDSAAESLIDWPRLQYMRKNMGESYQALASEKDKANARKKFLAESSASFSKQGIKPESLTNWQVQSQEPGGTLVTCSLPNGNTLSVTIAQDKLTSVQG